MIRFVATILVAVQALLPPGMCLCQFVPFGVTARQASDPVFSPLVAHVEDDGCCCIGCQKAAPVASSRPHEQAETECEAPHERDPLPKPISPCSGCPVVSAGPAARVALAPVPEQAPLDTAVPFVVSTVEGVSTRVDRPALLVKPAAPPLFVRHCAFLI